MLSEHTNTIHCDYNELVGVASMLKEKLGDSENDPDREFYRGAIYAIQILLGRTMTVPMEFMGAIDRYVPSHRKFYEGDEEAC